MIYSFKASTHKDGKRTFLPIPFNVWDETGLKGNIPCHLKVEGVEFECKLIPKGKGIYWIPLNKAMLVALPPKDVLNIELEPINSLTRINHDSPYSKENPIRNIDSIKEIPMVSGFCGHCCIAMLTGVSLQEVIDLIGKAHISWSKILEALDYYGISYNKKAIYPRGKKIILPNCCIVNNSNTFSLWYRDRFYGIKEIKELNIISYIEIF